MRTAPNGQVPHKPVRWAIASAKQNEIPVLTALTLPWDSNTGMAYKTWLTHPLVHHVKTVAKSNVTLSYPMQETKSHSKTAKTQWDVKFVIIANHQGLEMFLNQDLLASGFAKAAQNRQDRVTEINKIHSNNKSKTLQLQDLIKGLHAPSKFNKVSSQPAHDWRSDAERPELPSRMTNPVGLKHKPQEIIYTDGSSRKIADKGVATGSGVYREAAGARLDLKVCSCKQGMLNTITRAELAIAAIFVALRFCRPQNDEKIATDSKCSMDKIAKHLRDPKLTTNDCHQPMLQAIVQLLTDRARVGLQTTLMKVKSHIGIKGNEMADKLANQAACLAATDESPDVDVSVEHLEDLKNKFWPKQKITRRDEHGTEHSQWHNVKDLRNSLKTAINSKLRLGQSNQDSIYFRAWQELYQHMAPEYSNGFWNSPQVFETMITNLLNIRQGNMWNMKLAFQRKMAYRRSPLEDTQEQQMTGAHFATW